MEFLPINFIYTSGGLELFFFFIFIPLGTLISGILSIVYSIQFTQDKRNGKALQYTKRGLIISLVIFTIFLAALLFVLFYGS